MCLRLRLVAKREVRDKLAKTSIKKKEDGVTFAIFDTRNDQGNLIQYAKSNMAVSLSKQDVTLATNPTDIKAISVTH